MPAAPTNTSLPRSAARGTRPMQAVLILSALYFLSRFTGLLQSTIIGALLPATATDAYSIAFDLPDFLNYLVAGGAISLTFIPIFTRFWDKGKEAEAWRFFSTLLCLMSAVLAIITALMMIFTPQIMELTKPGLLELDKVSGMVPPDKQKTFDLAVSMTRVILPAQLFFYTGGLMLGVLNTFRRFGTSGWTSSVYNIVAILIAVPLWFWLKNPVVFAWGILLGAGVGNFLLPYWALKWGPRAHRPRFRFLLDWHNPQVRRFFILTLPIMLGVSLPVVDWMVVSYFGSSLGEGTLTHLRYGNRLMIAAQGVVGQAAAVAAFPYLSSSVAAQRFDDFADFLRVGLRRLMFVTLPLSVLLVLGARPLCALIYGYGKFNVAARLDETALCFAFFTVGLFAWAAQGLVSRGFYALGDTRTPTIVGSALTILFFIPLCAIFMRLQMGALGLSLATTIGAAAYFVAALVLLEAKLKNARYRAPIRLELLAGTLLRTMSACALMGFSGLLAFYLARPLVPNGKGGDLILLAWTWTIATVVFCAAAANFQIPEWNWLCGRLARKRPA